MEVAKQAAAVEREKLKDLLVPAEDVLGENIITIGEAGRGGRFSPTPQSVGGNGGYTNFQNTSTTLITTADGGGGGGALDLNGSESRDSLPGLAGASGGGGGSAFRSQQPGGSKLLIVVIPAVKVIIHLTAHSAQVVAEVQ